MDILQLLISTSTLIYVCYGDFFKDLEKLDIDSQLNEIDKMMNKIEVNKEEALDTLMDRGAEKVTNKAEDILSNMFNSECKYACPDGSKPKVRTSHKPGFNGCGSFGISFELDDLPEMTSCCNQHDICYDTCGTVRDDCDTDFKDCLDKMCKKLKKRLSKKEHQGCKDMAKLMYTGTLALGCSPYLDGQKEACICESESKSERKKTKNKPTDNKNKSEAKENRNDKARDMKNVDKETGKGDTKRKSEKTSKNGNSENKSKRKDEL